MQRQNEQSLTQRIELDTQVRDHLKGHLISSNLSKSEDNKEGNMEDVGSFDD